MSTSFSGVIPPILTPLTDAGELDTASFERLIDRLVAGGVDGLFVLGSSGEVAFMTDAVRRRVVEETVRLADGRVPVLVGVNDLTSARVIEQVRMAEQAGAAAIVATAPFYARPSQAETERHFRAIAEATELPLFAYDVPVRVFNKLDAQMLVQLGREGVIAGVKDSSGDDVSFRKLVLANRAAGSPLALFTGHEVVVDGALLGGADGVVPGLGNVDPVGYVELYRAAQAGDWERARALQDDLTALFDITSKAVGLSGEATGLGAFKTALVHLGVLSSNRMFEPVDTLDETTQQAIRQVVDAHAQNVSYPVRDVVKAVQ